VAKQTSVKSIAIDAIITHLKSVMITQVDPLDQSTRAGTIRYGLLQATPTDPSLTILLHPGDKDWPDVLYTSTFFSSTGLQASTYELGGPFQNTTWLRRFYLELKLFYVGLTDRDEAERRSHTILSRLHYSLMTLPDNALAIRDSFGETAFELQVREMYIEEGGGIGEFIYNGRLKLELLTDHDPNLAS